MTISLNRKLTNAKPIWMQAGRDNLISSPQNNKGMVPIAWSNPKIGSICVNAQKFFLQWKTKNLIILNEQLKTNFCWKFLYKILLFKATNPYHGMLSCCQHAIICHKEILQRWRHVFTYFLNHHMRKYSAQKSSQHIGHTSLNN